MKQIYLQFIFRCLRGHQVLKQWEKIGPFWQYPGFAAFSPASVKWSLRNGGAAAESQALGTEFSSSVCGWDVPGLLSAGLCALPFDPLSLEVVRVDAHVVPRARGVLPLSSPTMWWCSKKGLATLKSPLMTEQKRSVRWKGAEYVMFTWTELCVQCFITTDLNTDVTPKRSLFYSAKHLYCY